jgi:hypothetical protein
MLCRTYYSVSSSLLCLAVGTRLVILNYFITSAHFLSFHHSAPLSSTLFYAHVIGIGESIRDRQMSIDQLQTMQVIRGKRTTLGPDDAEKGHTGLFHAAPGRPRKADKVRSD